MGKSKDLSETILPTVVRARYIIPQFRLKRAAFAAASRSSQPHGSQAAVVLGVRIPQTLVPVKHGARFRAGLAPATVVSGVKRASVVGGQGRAAVVVVDAIAGSGGADGSWVRVGPRGAEGVGEAAMYSSMRRHWHMERRAGEKRALLTCISCSRWHSQTRRCSSPSPPRSCLGTSGPDSCATGLRSSRWLG